MKHSIGTFREWTKLKELTTPDQAAGAGVAINTDGSGSQMAGAAKKFLGQQSTKAVAGTSDFVNALSIIASEAPGALPKVVGAMTTAIRQLQDDQLDPETKEELVAALRSSVPGLKQLEAPNAGATATAPAPQPQDKPFVGGAGAKPLGNMRGTPQQ